ncbi:heavy metal translocating P-type ATPase [Cephaloticoccus capnophilus]|uniref:heavy metal translocating P-type ATPase n=1 Tax=Cephaloticoccus capnophilus TaxID=1548208 RepID=UPI0009EF38FE|nr:heavy metal translocating P-type ATPase metal-binding domain-containing protein [Cephaloticoccus capnophilus]
MNAAELKIDLLADTPLRAEADTPTKAVSRRRKKAPSCHHCGTALTDHAMRETGFCCSGCAYVYRLIHESGLDAYYRIKDPITAPVDATVFQPQNADWLAELQKNAEAETDEKGSPHTPHNQAATTPRQVKRSASATAKLGIQGISCAGCVWLIEKLFSQIPGARRITVNAQLGHMEISWTAGELSLPGFAQKLASFNYLVGPHDSSTAELESRALIRRIGLCTAFVMNTMLFTLPTYFGMEADFPYARLFGTLSLAFGTLSMLAGGGYFVRRAWAGLRHGLLHIDLPISLGILGAYLGSLYGWAIGEETYVYFDFVSTFIVLMLIGRWAQVCAVERNRRRLLSLQPRPQHIPILQPDGTLQPTPPERLQPGQILELRSGQILPVEAILETHASAAPESDRALSPASLAASTAREVEFSLASINGESAPRRFTAGQRIPAGALNLSRTPIRLRSTQAWAHSLLAELTATQSETEHRNPLLERIVQGYLIGILGIAALAALFWGFHTGGDLLKTGAIVTAILVVSCPCAIGLAFPLAEEIASVALRRRGVFVRSPRLWSLLHKVRTLVFDKTGTLTLETPILQNPEQIATLSEEARSALYSLIRDNPHPVSQCLLEALLASGPTPAALEGDVLEEIGCGVSLGPWSLGKAGWKAQEADGNARSATAMSPQAKGSATLFAYNDTPLATFHLADSIRSDAPEAIAKLRALGLEAHILSGDATNKVQATAAQLGLAPAHGHGQMSPQDKADWLRTHAPSDALMLGDGLNDSLAFDAALLRGTPVIHRGTLAQKADFYYLGRGIGGIHALFEVNAIRRRAERVILIFSVSYNLLAVGFAALGFINPLIAAILMPINSLLTLTLVSASMKGSKLQLV